MAMISRLFGTRRTFNWRYSFATAITVALHVAAFAMILAPVVAPQATERVNKKAVDVNVLMPEPKPPKPPPPPPEPPQQPKPMVLHRNLQTPPVPTPPNPPIVVAEPSPVAQVAPPPHPPAPPRAASITRPSAMPGYRSKHPPKYPAQAIRQQQQGTVLLKVLVGMNGKPLKVEIMNSSGYRSLDHAALVAARQWKFNPAMHNGKPRQGWVLIPIEFNLRQF